MQEVIRTTGVLQYEQFGFTNCVRFNDMLYLSGISALDLNGQVNGKDIETQTVQTHENIKLILRAAESGLDRIVQMTSFVVNLEINGAPYVAARRKILTQPAYTSAVIGFCIDDTRTAAGGSVLRSRSLGRGGPLWVKLRKAHREQMLSALPPIAPDVRTFRIDSFVPRRDSCIVAGGQLQGFGHRAPNTKWLRPPSRR